MRSRRWTGPSSSTRHASRRPRRGDRRVLSEDRAARAGRAESGGACRRRRHVDAEDSARFAASSGTFFSSDRVGHEEIGSRRRLPVGDCSPRGRGVEEGLSVPVRTVRTADPVARVPGRCRSRATRPAVVERRRRTRCSGSRCSAPLTPGKLLPAAVQSFALTLAPLAEMLLLRT